MKVQRKPALLAKERMKGAACVCIKQGGTAGFPVPFGTEAGVFLFMTEGGICHNTQRKEERYGREKNGRGNYLHG